METPFFPPPERNRVATFDTDLTDIERKFIRHCIRIWWLSADGFPNTTGWTEVALDQIEHKSSSWARDYSNNHVDAP